MKTVHPWCSYAHMTMDGRILYIGKGRVSRSMDFYPSRRSAYHLASIRKHCPQFVVVAVQPFQSEGEAFAREVAWISEARAAGHKLCNFTDGGEGASGRVKAPDEREKLRQAALKQWDTRGRKPKIKATGGICACTECGASITYAKVPRKTCSKRCDTRRCRRLSGRRADRPNWSP